jgi:class 3 adenylate cyclase
VYLGYQVLGSGDATCVYTLNSDESNIDLIWEEPDWAPFLLGTAGFARVCVYDRRGLGVSSRNVAPPNLETQVSDLLAIVDAIDAERVCLGGGSGGAMHALFAATHPSRVSAMLWNNPAARTAWSPDYPWGLGAAQFEADMRDAELWGTLEYARLIADWRAAESRGIPLGELGDIDHEPARLAAYAKMNRNTASPDVAREIARIAWDTDVRAVLPAVQAPTALTVGERDEVEEARYIASLMPQATVHVLSGRSGTAVGPVLDVLRDLLGVTRSLPQIDTILSTVLFTDIVDSTKTQAALGDRRWKELVLAHHAIVRDGLDRWRGVENDTAGDGFYATFDGPARAIRCALEVTERVRDLGIEVRAGVHTGECEVIEDKCGGLTVSIGARVASNAGPSEVLVSQTVKDLVAGSGLSFEERGERELKGVPDRWRLYRVVGG